MLPGIGDVIGQAGEPLERVESLEASSERGIEPRGVVEDGLAAVQVHELLQGDGALDQVGGDALEGGGLIRRLKALGVEVVVKPAA